MTGFRSKKAMANDYGMRSDAGEAVVSDLVLFCNKHMLGSRFAARMLSELTRFESYTELEDSEVYDRILGDIASNDAAWDYS